MIFDLANFSSQQCYYLMTQCLIPRPIAWVLTENTQPDSYNLAPFSYFTAVCSDPPILMFSIAPKANQNSTTNNTPCPKDTLDNILRTQTFVVHIAHYHQLQAVETTAKAFAYGDSELTHANLALTDFWDSPTPDQSMPTRQSLFDSPLTNPLTSPLKRLTNTPIAFACRLYDSQIIGNQQQTLVFGEIINTYVADDYVTIANNRIQVDADAINALCRLGAGYYAAVGEPTKPQKPT